MLRINDWGDHYTFLLMRDTHCPRRDPCIMCVADWVRMLAPFIAFESLLKLSFLYIYVYVNMHIFPANAYTLPHLLILLWTLQRFKWTFTNLSPDVTTCWEMELIFLETGAFALKWQSLVINFFEVLLLYLLKSSKNSLNIHSVIFGFR